MNKISQWEAYPESYKVFREGVTQTLLGNAMACPRRLWFHLNLLFNPEKEGNFAFGRMMHDVLDRMYSGVIKDDAGVTGYLDSLEGADPKNLALASALGRYYLIQYAKELKGKFTTEKAFDCRYPWEKTFLRLRGRRDIFFQKNKNEIWLMEHKFWSQINIEEIINTLPFDFQVNFYAWSYFQEHHIMPKGIIYNICRKPQNKMDKETADPAEFENRVFEAIKAKPEYYFYRIPISITAMGMKRFETDFILKIKRLCAMLQEPIYRNEFACFASYPCDYLDACMNQNLKLLKRHEILFNELEETK
jgi:hypothetical protein